MSAAVIAGLGIALYGASEWFDAIDYAVTGRHLIIEGRFAPLPLDYSDFFTQGAGAYGARGMPYPSPGYALAIGMLGFLRDDFSLSNGLMLSFALSILCAGLLYSLAFSFSRSAVLGILFFFLVFLHREFLPYTGKPLTDMGAMVFILGSAVFQLRGKTICAAILFGMAYPFREIAILFLPFLPLINPKALSLKTYSICLFTYCAALAPFYLLVKGANTYYSYGEGQSDYYIDHLSQTLATISFDTFLYLLNHIQVFFKKTAGLPLLTFLIFWKYMTTPAKKIASLGLLYGLLVCTLQSNSLSMPERHFLGTIPFLTLASLLLAHELVKKRRLALAALCVALLIVSGRIHRSPNLFLDALGQGKTPASAMATVRAPMSLSAFIPPGSPVLAFPGTFADYAVPACKAVSLPSPEEFIRKNNSSIAALLLAAPAEGWNELKGQPLLTDEGGNVFQRITVQDLPEGHAYFIRQGG